jgi:hypothetical protein
MAFANGPRGGGHVRSESFGAPLRFFRQAGSRDRYAGACFAYVHRVANANGDIGEPFPKRRRTEPAADANPTVRQRELGIRLRELRTGWVSQSSR